MQNGPSKEEQRNLIIAGVLSFLVIGLWQIFVVGPQQEAIEAERQLAAERAALEAPATPAPGVEGSGSSPALATPTQAAGPQSREEALSSGERVQIETPTIAGSLQLKGGRIDDLQLHTYRETLDPESPDVTLLTPSGTKGGYYADFGWVTRAAQPTPSPQTIWTRERGEVLSPNSPVVLSWDNGQGLTFRREISVDDKYLFTIRQSVENNTEEALSLTAYGLVVREGTPETTGFFVLHEGAVGVIGEELREFSYDDISEFEFEQAERGNVEKLTAKPGDWLGFTDKYWMTALVPAGEQDFTAVFKSSQSQFYGQLYQTDIRVPDVAVAPGQRSEVVTQFFAGAKELATIRDYQYMFDGQTPPAGLVGKISDFFFYDSKSRFIDSIDWGWFFFLTKPISELLLAIKGLVGNMGIAIILLTVLFKLVLFPLAHKSYVSMSKLKKLQPQVKELQERFGEDKLGMQKAMMELYKREKVNPAAGCLPILVQIPIFFSLYKVLFVTIETRHAPFFGWIQDLSAPDPSSILNLFGLLPFDAPGPGSILAIFSIGVLPILMGITMWIQQMLNPAPADPMQEKIFMMLPILFTFMLGTFASGLVLYWTANNLFTIIQQYTIMRSQGVEVDILGNMKRQLGLAPKESGST
ncbi:MAG: membrane protein insertase YidC [Neomegalonema sp.]|nr:membrane protein insertase YidC [Neomegalonema sp.]